MPLLSLPNELILSIIKYLCYDNHLHLVPIASTCYRLHHLAADRTIWSEPVRVVIDQSSPFTTGDLLNIIQTTPQDDLHTTHVTLAIETASSADRAAEFLHYLIATRTIQTLQIHAPASTHGHIFSAHPSFDCVDDMTVRDSRDECSNQAGHQIHLIHSRTLRTIDLPTCTVHPWLHGDDGTFFPQVTSLTIMVTEPIDARRFKQAFPNLKKLGLHLTCADHVSLIRPLLTDKRLYPWIEQLSVVCKDDLRVQLGKNEIEEIFMSLDGVSRLNVGWDMVAVSSV